MTVWQGLFRKFDQNDLDEIEQFLEKEQKDWEGSLFQWSVVLICV